MRHWTRQHPRDLFDIKILYEHEGITDEIRKAFVIYLASHDRPMHELLSPKRADMRKTFDNEFSGMTGRTVTYDELEAVREKLIIDIIHTLTLAEKRFLITMKQGMPEWNILGIPDIDKLPALQWKLRNIRNMDTIKRTTMLNALKAVLHM